MSRQKLLKLLGLIASLVLAALIGFIAGMERGHVVGQRHSIDAVNQALIEGARDIYDFRVQGIDLVFKPWRDRSNRVTIAGAGGEGRRR